MIDTPDSVSDGETLTFDVCIVGAGAAGITLALEMADSGLKIGLMEGGGLTPPPFDEGHPYHGRSSGREYSLIGTRLRFFGGTTNHWGGWCRPLDPVDFQKRPHIEHSGWPIAYGALTPYYPRACAWCEIEPPSFELKRLPGELRRREEFFGSYDPDFVSKNFRFSPPTRFGARYREDIRRAASIHCFLQANLVELEQEGRKVSRLRLRTEGKEFFAQAQAVVLAMGGIENARLLLASAGAGGRGVANESDFVGRCFTDHLGRTLGKLLTSRKVPYRFLKQGELQVHPHLSLRDEVLEQHRLVNFGIALLGVRSEQLLPDDYLGDERLFTGWRGGREGDVFHAVARFEPTPNPRSRVTLINERDKYGVPRVELDWTLNPIEFEALDRLAGLLVRKTGRAGLGRFQRSFLDASSARVPDMTYQSHQLGTTRMSEDPRQGVVDGDCRAHTMENLYIAGSSVFPTFGFANPTLTIVALAIRLADHLKKSMGRS